MLKRLLLGIAAAIAVFVVTFEGAGLAVHADGGGSISGLVYFDEDLDGQRDSGEQPAPGRTVRLVQYGDQANVESTTQSGRDGRYQFDGLDRDLTYAVDVVTSEETPCIIQTYGDLTPDMEWSGQDRGVLLPGDIRLSGTLIEDLNANGTRDAGETGLQGWSIDVQSREMGGVFCGVVVETGSDGQFSLGNLPPYKFDLGTEAPSYPATGQWIGTFPSIASSPFPGSRVFSWTVDLTNSGSEVHSDAGFHVLAGTSAISGFVYTDRNLNGTFDSDEHLVDCALIRGFFQAYWQLPIGSFRIGLGNAGGEMPCENGTLELNRLEAGTYTVGMPWCGIPGTTEHRLQGVSEATVTLAEDQRIDNVAIAICPAADTGPAPDAPTSWPAATTTPVTPSDSVPASSRIVGPPITGSGDTASTNRTPWIATAIALVVVGIAGTVYALRQLQRRA